MCVCVCVRVCVCLHVCMLLVCVKCLYLHVHTYVLSCLSIQHVCSYAFMHMHTVRVQEQTFMQFSKVCNQDSVSQNNLLLVFSII